MSQESSARQTTRARILDATEELLQNTSSQHFKVADIASKAGVSPSLVIQYFNTKDELIFETWMRRMLRVGPSLFEPFLEPNQKADLFALLRFLLEQDIDNGHVTIDVMSLSWRWSAQDEFRFAEALSPRRAALTRLLTQAVAPRPVPAHAIDAAETIYAGALRRALVHGLTVEQSFAALKGQFDLLLAGLRR